MKKINNSGVAFVTAIVLMVLFLNLGLGYLMMARTQLMIARNQISTLKAFYYSESALQHSIAELVNNVDKDADGLGNIPLQDLDGDASMDYSATYNSSTNIISSTGNTGVEGIVRTIETNVKPKIWIGFMQAGRNIVATTGNNGTVTGFLYASGTISLSPLLTGGLPRPNTSTLITPTVSLPSYKASADHVYPVLNSYMWNGQPPDGNGSYYINGNLTIAGVNNFNLQGSLIVSGALNISACTGSFTIQPAGNYPAIVVGGSIGMTSTWKPTIYGVVYAGQDISLSSLTGPTRIFAGALVAGRDINLTNTTFDQFTFGSSLNPPYFTGAGAGLAVNYWKGHK